MSVSWLENGGHEPSTQCQLSDLVKSIVDAEDPIPGVQRAIGLAGRLILSNHLREAGELLAAAYSFAAKIGDDRVTPGNSYQVTAYQVFWHTHPELKRPDPIPDFPTARLEHGRWGKYRECTRTGWMLDVWGLAEPDDPSVWRGTDDPVLLAMCTRLLAKTVVPATYPPPERMREALDAARKLYAQPELPAAAWLARKPWLQPPYATQPRSPDTSGTLRHPTLVCRRLAVELALRLGDFPTAADLLSKALTSDGLTHDGSVEHYLLLPGIYDALPLLAEGGTGSSLFFLSKDDAAVLVDEVAGALKLRAEEGRQWALAENKVGWEELLSRLAAAAWKVHGREYRFQGCKSADDILYDPATDEEIREAEERVGELPSDLKDMVRVANGFKGGHHLFGGGIAGVENIRPYEGYLDLRNFAGNFREQNLRQDYGITGTMIELEAGSESDGFLHFIIPPAMWKANVVGREVKEGEYQYWHWAAWMGDISRWNSIRDYVASCVEEVEGMAERGEVAEFDVDFDEFEVEDRSDASDD